VVEENCSDSAQDLSLADLFERLLDMGLVVTWGRELRLAGIDLAAVDVRLEIVSLDAGLENGGSSYR
jgi:hypothetical protein